MHYKNYTLLTCLVKQPSVFKLYFQDGGHDVISCRKVLPPGECICSVCLAHMQQRPPVPDHRPRGYMLWPTTCTDLKA